MEYKIKNTPIEEYKVGKHTVYVKRDDMFLHDWQSDGLPALAKLRGAFPMLEKLKDNGVRTIGVFDTRISKAGQGIAYLCNRLKLECWVGYPQLKGQPIPQQQIIAKKNGAILYGLKAGRTAILYSQFKKFVTDQQGHMLPLGLVCQETIWALRSISATIEIPINSIVLSTGTATIATGVASGNRATVYGISCGMSVEKQWKRVRTLAPNELLGNLRLIPPKYDYYTAIHDNCPFPTSPYYDAKAWEWLVENIERIEHPVLFWNIGI